MIRRMPDELMLLPPAETVRERLRVLFRYKLIGELARRCGVDYWRLYRAATGKSGTLELDDARLAWPVIEEIGRELQGLSAGMSSPAEGAAATG